MHGFSRKPVKLREIRDFRGNVDLAVGAPLKTINIPKGILMVLRRQRDGRRFQEKLEIRGIC